MPLIPSPRHLADRAELNHQLGSLVQAGIPLISALETMRRSPPAPSFRTPLGKLIANLENGSTFSDALAALGPGWMPSFDTALIRAGETSGRLDVCFRLLGEYYRERAQLAREILSGLAYPALVLHFAVLIFPIQKLTSLVTQGDVVGFLVSKAMVLIPLYAAVLLLLYLCQGRRHSVWRSILERITARVPVLGTARKNLALARLSLALESLLSAGVSILDAWPLAAAASGSPGLSRSVRDWMPSVESGQTPAEAVRECKAFPELFANLYSTGEVSGRLDDTLRRLHEHYQEEAMRSMKLLAEWTPRFVYFLVVLLAAYQIISFWTGYFSQVNGLIS